MTITRLQPKLVEKIWGRRDLPPPFGPVPPDRPPVGEVWFEDAGGGDDLLLVKFLFTSEKLSVQVHPGDAAARLKGLPSGKEEAWWVLAAEEGARIGLGVRGRLSKEALRSAATDGSIEQLLDWRPARAGDHYYSPAGTIHAIGAGLSLVEVQQNSDVTYRLFDYGRDRELHLEAAVAAANAVPYEPHCPAYDLDPGRTILAHGGAFVLERWAGPRSARIDAAAPAWIVPIKGAGTIDAETIEAGGVWRVEGAARVALEPGSELLVAYAGGAVREDFLRS